MRLNWIRLALLGAVVALELNGSIFPVQAHPDYSVTCLSTLGCYTLTAGTCDDGSTMYVVSCQAVSCEGPYTIGSC
jgi:hypothetical protein